MPIKWGIHCSFYPKGFAPLWLQANLNEELNIVSSHHFILHQANAMLLSINTALRKGQKSKPIQSERLQKIWLGSCTSDWSIWILRESKGGQRGQSISRTNWFWGAFEKLRLVLGVINVKCKAQLVELKPVLSFLKQMALITYSI